VIGDVLLSVSLMLGEGGEPLAQLVFRGDCLLDTPLGHDNLCLGVRDGLTVVPSPPPAAGLLQSGLARREHRGSLVSLPNSVGQSPAGLLPLVSTVVRNTGVDRPAVAFGGGARVAELVDPEGERVVDAHAGDCDVGPVVVESLVETAQFLARTRRRITL